MDKPAPARRARPTVTTMRLQMTVVRMDTAGEPLEVEVECASGATAADLEPALRGMLGIESLGGVHVGGRRLVGSEPVGCGPLVDGAVLAVGGATRVTDSPGDVAVHASALSLAVVGGPDSGRSFDVRAGTLRIGRAGDADLVVDDPDLSRIHAELAVGPDGVTLRDCGSTNGSSIDGRRLGGEPRPSPPPAWSPSAPADSACGHRRLDRRRCRRPATGCGRSTAAHGSTARPHR